MKVVGGHAAMVTISGLDPYTEYDFNITATTSHLSPVVRHGREGKVCVCVCTHVFVVCVWCVCVCMCMGECVHVCGVILCAVCFYNFTSTTPTFHSCN